MPHRRKLAVFLVLLLCMGTVSGCTGNRLSHNGGKPVVDVIVKKSDADYWKVVQMGAEAAGGEFNVTVNFIGPTDERDIDLQMKMVDNAVDARVDAIVLAASDYTRLVEPVDRAVDAGIPVVVIDSDVKTDRTQGFVGTNNVDAGRSLATSLLQKVGENCNVVVMGFVRGAATSDQREQGVKEVLESHTGVKVLKTLYCNSDESYAKILTQELIQEHPDVNAIVCLNAYGTVGVARGIEGLRKQSSVQVIGFDSTPEEIQFLDKGVIQALVIQNPYKMGYLGVKYALDAIAGRKVPKTEDTGATVIDRDNMYLPENQKLLFPFTN